jgi:hypothetical protein
MYKLRAGVGLLVAATAMAAIPLFVASPADAAAAANPRTHYSLSYGGGEYTLKGNLIWYSRTVQVGASLKANEQNCAKAVYKFYHGTKVVGEANRSACARTVGHGFRRQYNHPGGITRVVITLWQSNKNSPSALVDSVSCDRKGCH